MGYISIVHLQGRMSFYYRGLIASYPEIGPSSEKKKWGEGGERNSPVSSREGACYWNGMVWYRPF